MSTRNYALEMRAVIDEATGQGPYVPRQLATEIVEKLRANDDELLNGWLDEQAEHFVWQAINDRDRSVRAHARVHSRRRAFGIAAEKHQAGEKEALRDFLGMRFTVEDGSRRALAVLGADDLTFVAATYEQRERENAFMKVFMRALAKKVGSDTVGDHFTNEQLSAMFDSLGG